MKRILSLLCALFLCPFCLPLTTAAHADSAFYDAVPSLAVFTAEEQLVRRCGQTASLSDLKPGEHYSFILTLTWRGQCHLDSISPRRNERERRGEIWFGRKMGKANKPLERGKRL